MRVTRRAVLGTATALGTTVLAGCLGDDDDNGDDDGTPDDETPDAEPATIQVREHPDLGDILVSPDEMTLYMFDQDTQGEDESACYDGCAENWRPLTVDEETEPTAGEGVTADLTTFERDTGERQVAADGWPLYDFAPDKEPGDANGQGANDAWWVLAPDGTPVRDDGSTAEEESGSGEDTPEDGEGEDDGNDLYRVRTRA